MRRARIDHLLTGAAVALALSITGYIPAAFAQSNPQIETAVPVPDISELPPPTIADISPPPASAPVIVAKPAQSQPSEAKASDVKASDVKPVAAKADSKPAPDTTGTVPAAGADTADATVAEKLRDLASGKFDRVIGGKKERAGVEAFYSGRNYAPLWITQGALNERGKAAVAYLARVDADGLDPADYQTPDLRAGAEADALAEAELKLSQAVLSFARHAMAGRVHYSRISADIEYDLSRPELGDALNKLAASANVAETLDSFHPQHAGYKALKAKLAEARGVRAEAAHRIPAGPTLKYGKDKKGKEIVTNDSRIPLLRERLGVAGEPADTSYDKKLADAVSKFQREHDLSPNGQLNAATVEALNGARRSRDSDVIIANMERWRWMPRDLGNTHVIVNIPDFSLRVVRDGKLVWNTRIVVGKTTQVTPIMSAEMKYITVNPTWNVPPSIIQNEYLPALQADPNALERVGLKVVYNRDGTIRIYQPPGERNALGRIRFNFPNKFLVYQHDTPDKHLFAHDKRAYSHGCMRVQDPLKYGEVLLSLVRPEDGYSQEKLRKMFGGSEVNINFPVNIPVHLTYQTAFVDDAGKLQIRDDLYGRDGRLLVALKGSERRVAELPMDRPKNTSAHPVRLAPGTYGSEYGPRGATFFDQLFGGSFYQAPPRPRRSIRSSQNFR
jgi:murein L,D-transpeptidase YcbB/YkuD